MAEETTIVGADKAVSDLARWAKVAAPAEMAQALEPLTERISSEIADSKVPVLTGTLASTVTHTREADVVGVGMGGPEAPYSGWIEFGGYRGRDYIPQGRYVFPTVIDHEPDIAKYAEQGINDSIERYPWSNPSSS